MGRARRMVQYSDSRIIKNGTTTIIYGDITITARGKIRDNLEKMYDMTAKMLRTGHGETKGVSKLYPGDTYDELTGKIVASKKSEMQGIRVCKKIMQEYIESLETVLTDMKNQVALADARYTALEKDNH